MFLRNIALLNKVEQHPGGRSGSVRLLAGSVGACAMRTPPAFFINRCCDKERLAAVQIELGRAGIAAERIAAVDGLAVPEEFRRYFFVDGLRPTRLSPGEVGCYASHLTALKLVVDRGLDSALILEDDAVLPDRLAETVGDILAALPNGWDLVHLCANPSRAVKPVVQLDQSRQLVRYSRIPFGAVGYLISRQGAEKFLAPVERTWPIDTDFRRPWQFRMEVYGVVPKLIGHSGELKSAILSHGERARRRRGIPWPSRQNWTGNPLHSPAGAYYNMLRLGPLWWMSCWWRNTRRRLARSLDFRPAALRTRQGW